MPTLQFSTVIHRPIEDVFTLLTDLANYGNWLPPSETFREIKRISDNPIKLGTMYIDQGTRIVFQGTVTRYEPPNYVTFHQTTQFKLFILNGGMDIDIVCQLESVEGGTRLHRQQIVELSGFLKFAQTPILKMIQPEVERIMQSMKIYLEV
ncbi:MAG: SRPBCC family protein [Chitinophagaceae bacterium]|nr:SRPBCC family protein [Anaerolineae bacterium]